MDNVRPRLVISECLGVKRCRYNGDIIEDPFIEGLKKHVEIMSVCPEVEIGLGVPRDPIRLVADPDGRHDVLLIQPSTGRDLTEKMKAFASRYLGGVRDVDGFVLKSASPSCAVKDAKFFRSAEPGPVQGRRSGLFGAAVQATLPEAVIEDEGRLRNLSLRHHFLTRLFTKARFRVTRREGRLRSLIRFQARHKMLLMAYNQTRLRELGRIVANAEKSPVEVVYDQYGQRLDAALARLPRHTSNINVLMHALGYVSDELTSREKAFFLDLLQQYRDMRVPLSTPAEVIRSWLIRSNVEYLLDQFFFEPFPPELMHLADSGRGRLVS